MKLPEIALAEALEMHSPEDMVGAAYHTREELAAERHNSVVPYLRLEDPLCRKFLQMAATSAEFEGLKLLFPFFRELSLLRFPRTKSKLGVWMQLAFMAGHDLGRANPDRGGDVLPGLELREGVRRVGVLQQCSGEEHLSFAGLQKACAHIVEAQWSQVPDERLDEVLLEAVVKSLRTGFAAATICQVDPSRCEFVWDIPERIGGCITDIVSRAIVGAAREAVGQPVLALLSHPLLRLARELYPAQPAESDTVLRFLRGCLLALDVQSENDCLGSELDLVDWIEAAMSYGRQVKQQNPEVVESIFHDARGERLQGAIRVVQKVVAEAGGTDPMRLLARLKCWQQGVYGWSEPTFYGEELARVAYLADFAIWIPWVCNTTSRVECMA